MSLPMDCPRTIYDNTGGSRAAVLTRGVGDASFGIIGRSIPMGEFNSQTGDPSGTDCEVIFAHDGKPRDVVGDPQMLSIWTLTKVCNVLTEVLIRPGNSNRIRCTAQYRRCFGKAKLRFFSRNQRNWGPSVQPGKAPHRKKPNPEDPR